MELEREIQLKIDSVHLKIRELRRNKGLSNDNLAADLDMSTSAYNKLERQESKLTLDRFFQIVQVLGTSEGHLLGLKQDKTYNQSFQDDARNYQEIQEFREQMPAYNELIKTLKEEIQFLRKQLEGRVMNA